MARIAALMSPPISPPRTSSHSAQSRQGTIRGITPRRPRRRASCIAAEGCNEEDATAESVFPRFGAGELSGLAAALGDLPSSGALPRLRSEACKQGSENSQWRKSFKDAIGESTQCVDFPARHPLKDRGGRRRGKRKSREQGEGERKRQDG
jgi:hypothetical protein